MTKAVQRPNIVDMETEEMQYDFSPEKNRQLISERNISFEMVVAAISDGAVLDI